MDPFTHGIVGAATATSVSSSRVRLTACAGFIAALLPDLDVFLSRANDPLFQLEFHRQFSHSLVFTPVGALVATLLLWLPMRGNLAFKSLYLACFCGYAGAGLLDACTSYGTQLLWPFSAARIAWNLTPVVEPIITLGMLALLSTSVLRQQAFWSRLALLWLALLLAHGAYRQHQALLAAEGLWASRAHKVQHFVVKPTLANQILWRVSYIHDGRVYTDGVRTKLLGVATVYQGESGKLLVLERDFAALSGTPLYDSLFRFSQLSDGFLIAHPDHPNVVGDARYSMLPTTLSPLWGLEYDPNDPDRSVTFQTYRDAGQAVRERFLEMLFAKPDRYHVK